MGKPLVYEIAEKPITTALIAICTGVWVYIQKAGLGYGDVGISYEDVVRGKQYWRVITSTFSHVSFLHLIFNMSALWSVGVVEQLGHAGMGKMYYLKNTLLLVILSLALVLVFYHFLIHRLKLERYWRVTAVGYSCVIFGWMTILSQKQAGSKIQVLGFLSLPASLAPFESLIFTYIIAPQASFLGHLSGIIVGYLISWGGFAGISSYWAITYTSWLLIALVVSVERTTSYHIPFLRIGSSEELPDLPTVRLLSDEESPQPRRPPPLSLASGTDAV
ncbi:hypothetical protein CBR_g12522 [Chara braunii]|uniref:Peptidase S54 rhomboid domain-containing protein n=1 Tax=Chara braunii TaxID=69332 RepID=A0A388JSI8_CHABU|nr:hypothetical protein CBR_g12522 [Chara braunii]|eukprot:GBG60784.1 hypothetical protein CBR_g12522 [Chara braunii]